MACVCVSSVRWVAALLARSSSLRKEQVLLRALCSLEIYVSDSWALVPFAALHMSLTTHYTSLHSLIGTHALLYSTAHALRWHSLDRNSSVHLSSWNIALAHCERGREDILLQLLNLLAMCRVYTVQYEYTDMYREQSGSATIPETLQSNESRILSIRIAFSFLPKPLFAYLHEYNLRLISETKICTKFILQ